MTSKDSLGGASAPRPYTEAEAVQLYLERFRRIAKYWAEVPNQTDLERCQGAVFSILTLIDGATIVPGLILTPNPHPDDKEYFEAEGQNWFEPGMKLNPGWHEMFFEKQDA